MRYAIGCLHRITRRKRRLSVSDSDSLLLTEGWRSVEVPWAEVVRVDVWQIDAWVHVIGVYVWLARLDGLVSADERSEGYKELTAALAYHLQPFDQEAWDYVHSDFFADVSRTVYRRSNLEAEA